MRISGIKKSIGEALCPFCAITGRMEQLELKNSKIMCNNKHNFDRLTLQFLADSKSMNNPDNIKIKSNNNVQSSE